MARYLRFVGNIFRKKWPIRLYIIFLNKYTDYTNCKKNNNIVLWYTKPFATFSSAESIMYKTRLKIKLISTYI